MDSFSHRKKKREEKRKTFKKVASEVGRENMCEKIVVNELEKVEKTNYYI
jgi:hypothetical protein